MEVIKPYQEYDGRSSVSETVSVLQEFFKQAGVIVFVIIDHQKAAEGEEGVHVDVEDIGAGVVLAPGAAGGGGSGRSAHGGSPFSAVSAVHAPQASLFP